jgi:hypothetical protein
MVFKEDPMLDAFEGHPPDYVALVSLDTSEFGPRFFGRDYGRKLGEWIRANYHTVSLFGAVPLQDGRFGIALLQRNQAP